MTFMGAEDKAEGRRQNEEVKERVLRCAKETLFRFDDAEAR
jgi:hypothetical protein